MGRKVYVAVDCRCDRDGVVMPMAFYWEDGTRYVVDRVLDRTRAASLKAGGVGDRYTVSFSNDELDIHGKVRYLFFERGEAPERWFLEGR